MKITFNLCFLLIFFCLFSCTKPEDDLQESTTGKVYITFQEPEREVIELTNARIKASEYLTIGTTKLWVDILQGENIVTGKWYSPDEFFELKPGTYKAHLKWIVQEGVYKDRIYSEGISFEFNVEAGRNAGASAHVTYNFVEVRVKLIGLDGAKVWVGPTGFVPSDSYLFTEEVDMANFYPDGGGFEVVVEFEGETKRYGAEAKANQIFKVIIENKPDEEPDEEEPEEEVNQVKISFDITYLRNAEKWPTEVYFEW